MTTSGRDRLGIGLVLHRAYAVRIADSAIKPAALIDLVAADLNRASPEMAVFRRTGGAGDRMETGDEFVVRMPGPWDGPVRVVRREPDSFRLATLDGHLEAGEIEFRAARDGDVLASRSSPGPRQATGSPPKLSNELGLAEQIQPDHVVALLRPGRGPGGRPPAGRRHDPHPLGRLAASSALVACGRRVRGGASAGYQAVSAGYR